MGKIRICVAGATGWTGSAVVKAVLESPDMELAAAISRGGAGKDAALLAGLAEPCGVLCTGFTEEALAQPFDVWIDYTSPHTVKEHCFMAIGAGRNVVVGTSGLTAADYAEVDAAARAAGVGVVASGNYAITAALMIRFSLMAARYIDAFEVLDYASQTKPDVPSGTARELAERLGNVHKPVLGKPIDQIIGPQEARGATVNGVQVHSLRLPSYSASVTAEFAVPGARLTMTHDAGTEASVYADGTLLAARKVVGIKGLVRGLDNLLD